MSMRKSIPEPAAIMLATLIGSSISFPAFADAPKESFSSGLRFDCLHNNTRAKGTTQLCGQVTGLKLRYDRHNGSYTQFSITIDPFNIPSKSLQNQVATVDNPLPTALESQAGIISDFLLAWQFRHRLALGIELFGGTTQLPVAHKLALGSRFPYSGWNQTAMTATYSLGKEGHHKVTFAVGNGEGESVHNLDPQQYGGISVLYRVMPGMFVKGAGSIDGNNYGSETAQWVYDADLSDIKSGFSILRTALSVYATPDNEFIPGLAISLGIQKSDAKDLDKGQSVIDPNVYIDNKNLTLRDLLVEDQTNQTANTVSSQVFDFGVSYAIMANHFVSANYETRTIDSGTAGAENFFEDKNGTFHKKISQTGYGVGFSLNLDKDLDVTLEYRFETYTKDYKTFNYTAANGKTSKEIDLFNARILYSW